MPSLLIATANDEAFGKISQAIAPLGIRVRRVSDSVKAREWITMANYEMVLIDYFLESSMPLSLCRTIWKHSPLSTIGVFNLYGPIPNPWPALLMGVQIYSESNAVASIKSAVTALEELEVKREEYGVLVIDDLDSPRDIICAYVESLGYSKVAGARSADEGMKMLLSGLNENFAIILDIQMPQKSGLAFLRELRREKQTAHLPVIILTANASAENLVDCVREGASGFLVKPPKRKDLSRELDKAKRIFFGKYSPRLCAPEDAHHLESALRNATLMGD